METGKNQVNSKRVKSRKHRFVLRVNLKVIKSFYCLYCQRHYILCENQRIAAKTALITIDNNKYIG